MEVLAALFAFSFPALMIVAALKDATSFTIPNWISLALAAAFAPAALAAGFGLAELGVHLAVGLLALVLGIAMFAVGWIGGGDAKLFAAAGLWVGLPLFAPFVMITALAGGALAVFLVSLRADWVRARAPVGPPWVERLRAPGGNAPYGVAIAVGALLVFPQSPLANAIAALG